MKISIFITLLFIESLFACNLHKLGTLSPAGGNDDEPITITRPRPTNNLPLLGSRRRYYKDPSKFGVSRAEYDEVLDKIEAIYKPYLKPAGIRFHAERAWDDPKINATVVRERDIWAIIMYGGVPQSEYATKDAFILLACHEVGHHLGHTHYYPKEKDKWISAEGQADYFAATKCMRVYLEDMDNAAYLATKEVPAVVSQKCSEVWGDEEQKNICIRTAIAGYELNRIWRGGNTFDFDFEKKNMEVVKETKVRHPEIQCRLDTYMQGALCTVSKDVPFSPESADIGSCNSNDGHTVGLRPKCWYAGDK